MKCEMIRDLLPLYIDGLTSEESRIEIEKHLASCKECQTYYQEMTGVISGIVPIPEEDFQDVDLIKKIKQKNKTKTAGIIIGSVLIASIIAILIVSQMYSQAKYKEVAFDYGIEGNNVYFTMESKPGYELQFSGSSVGNDLTVEVMTVRKIGNFKKDKMGWKSEMGTQNAPCKWTIKFQDKTLVIENGKLVAEKENKKDKQN